MNEWGLIGQDMLLAKPTPLTTKEQILHDLQQYS